MTKYLVLGLSLSLSACAKFDAQVSPTRGAAVHASTNHDVAIEVTPVDGDGPRMTRVRILDYRAGVDQTLYARVEWRARGAGTLAIEGPEGILIATGVVLPNGGAWFRDVADEKPLSGGFARGVAFGESDPARLKALTLTWLNEVIAPELDRRLRRETPPPPLP